MVYEPGPITPQSFELGPRIVTPGLFEGLAAPLAAFVTSGDAALAGYSAILAPLVGRELAPSFETDVVPAIVALDGLDTVADALDIAGVVGVVDSTLADLDVLAADLPNPNDDAEADPIDAGGDLSGGDQD